MLLPKRDGLQAPRHARITLSLSVHYVSSFVGNPAENWFSHGMHPIFVGRQDLCTLGECGINPVGLCVEMRRFGDLLAPGVSVMQEENILST